MNFTQILLKALDRRPNGSELALCSRLVDADLFEIIRQIWQCIRRGDKEWASALCWVAGYAIAEGFVSRMTARAVVCQHGQLFNHPQMFGNPEMQFFGISAVHSFTKR